MPILDTLLTLLRPRVDPTPLLAAPEDLAYLATTEEDEVEAAPQAPADARDLGNDYTGPMEIEEARRRYGFVAATYRKAGITDEAVLDATTEAYADYRRRNRLAYYTEGQVPGWRFAALEQFDSAVQFTGVDEQGLIHQKHFSRRNSWGTGQEASFDWSFADPLSQTREIAAAAADRKDLRDVFDNVTPKQSYEPAFIIQSQAFRIVVENRRDQICNTLFEAGEKTLSPDPWPTFGKATAQISYIARRDEVRRYGAMTNAFMRALDPEVQKAMRSLASFSPQLSNWLSGQIDYTMQRDAQLARNRQQAVAAFPLLAKTVSQHGSCRAAIDAGEPLLPVLAQALQIDAKKVSRLAGLSWQKAGRSYFRDTAGLSRVLRHVDVNHIPGTRRGFAALRVAEEAATMVAMNSRTRKSEQFASMGGQFEKVAELAEGNPPAGIGDMAKSIRFRLIAPAMVQAAMKAGLDANTAIDGVSNLIHETGPLDGLSPRNALQNSARWHRNERIIGDMLDDEAAKSAVAWEPVAGTVTLDDALHAEELDTRAKLRTEGATKNHCVGSYTEAVIDGYSLIFSLRDKAGNIHSTIEFGDLGNTREKVASDGTRTQVRDLSIIQNMGDDNSQPSEAALSAGRKLKAHLDTLPAETWDAYLSGLEHNRVKRRETEGRPWLVQNCGFDPTQRANLEKSWEVMSPYLPRGDRKKGLDGWIKDTIAPQVRPLVQQAKTGVVEHFLS